jgi:all-trans-retinol dehydrogenase (NAD+)
MMLLQSAKFIGLFIWSILDFFTRLCRKKSTLNLNFTHDIVLITGGAQGLGKELAMQFSECGATVILWDIDEAKLDQTCSQITAKGRDAFGYVVDCSDKRQVYETAEKIKEEIGNVSILVNNAAILKPRTFLDTKDSDILATLNVNILSYIWTIRAFLGDMAEANNGHIVNISSLATISSPPKAVVYTATKSAIMGLTYALNNELLFMSKQRGVNFTVVCPARIEETGLGELQLYPWPNTPGLSLDYVGKRILQAVSDKEFLVDIPSSRFDAILRL